MFGGSGGGEEAAQGGGFGCAERGEGGVDGWGASGAEEEGGHFLLFVVVSGRSWLEVGKLMAMVVLKLMLGFEHGMASWFGCLVDDGGEIGRRTFRRLHASSALALVRKERLESILLSLFIMTDHGRAFFLLENVSNLVQQQSRSKKCLWSIA